MVEYMNDKIQYLGGCIRFRSFDCRNIHRRMGSRPRHALVAWHGCQGPCSVRGRIQCRVGASRTHSNTSLKLVGYFDRSSYAYLGFFEKNFDTPKGPKKCPQPI